MNTLARNKIINIICVLTSVITNSIIRYARIIVYVCIRIVVSCTRIKTSNNVSAIRNCYVAAFTSFIIENVFSTDIVIVANRMWNTCVNTLARNVIVNIICILTSIITNSIVWYTRTIVYICIRIVVSRTRVNASINDSTVGYDCMNATAGVWKKSINSAIISIITSIAWSREL